MSHSSSIDFSGCIHVNHLWPQLVERLGMEKAKQAVVQALDLQRMHGHCDTLPVLFAETCGLALVNIDLLRSQMGLLCYGDSLVLMLSTKQKAVQLLKEV